MKTKCKHCKGTGKRSLSTQLDKTLAQVLLHPNNTTEQYRGRGNGPGTSKEAAMRRLVTLEEMGLVERNGKEGSFVKWRVTRSYLNSIV